MMEDDSQQHLQRFSRDRSPDAFRSLVAKHSALVYATALRKLNGDHASAEDVTQEVFLLLARKAHSLTPSFLSAWLHRQACRRASNHIRSEQRRRQREKIAADLGETSAPSSPFLHGELDDTLLSLRSEDHQAIVLRFFEGKDYQTIGHHFGITAEAARKRVKRALDQLSSRLKSNSLALTGASLEIQLLAIDSPPVPGTLLAKISSLPPTSPAIPLLLLVKPILAGGIAASLITAPTLAVKHSADPPATETASIPPRERPKPISRLLSPLPDPSSLETIVNEIKRSNVALADSLTKIRLTAILGSLSVEQIPRFIELAETRLGPAERAATYEPLFKRWAAADPEAALGFILENNTGGSVNEFNSTNLLGSLFRNWADNDLATARTWLIAHLDHPGLQASSLQENFLKLVTTRHFIKGDTTALFSFLDQLPTSALRTAALGAVTGKDNMNAGWEAAPTSAWISFHETLSRHPDARLRESTALAFWKNVATHQSGRLAEIGPTLAPDIRFQASLGQLAAEVRPVDKLDSKGRLVSRSFEKITDRTAAEAIARETGALAEIPPADIDRSIGLALVSSLSVSEFSSWQAAHPTDLDDAILSRARRELSSATRNIHHPNPLHALEWRARISDPDLRSGITRAAFLRLLAENPDVAATVPSRTDLPADVITGLQPLIPTVP